MRVVDAKDLDAVIHPVADHTEHFVVETGGVVVEVDRVDVLVLLRRVLGVGDGAVRQFGEPLAVVRGPRVIRRALQRQIERYLQTEISRGGDELVEVGDRAQLRMHRVVAAFVAADRPRRADVTGRGRGGVVAALSVHLADRVDRRQVDHVEAHLRDARQAAAAVAKVPCTGLTLASQPPVERGNSSYQDPKLASGRSTQTPYCSPRVTSSRSGYCVRSSSISGVNAGRGAGNRIAGSSQRFRGLQQRLAPGAGNPGRGPLHQLRPDQQIVGQLALALTGIEFGLDGVAPGVDRVAPAVDPIRPQPDRVRSERPMEDVRLVARRHRHMQRLDPEGRVGSRVGHGRRLDRCLHRLEPTRFACLRVARPR